MQLLRDWIASMKPSRPLVKAWQVSDFAELSEQVTTGRSLKSGQAAFREIGCNQCHRIAGEGGSVGPDLTGIARRQAAQELLRSILLPSDAIADEYATHQIETNEGKIVTGRIEREDEMSIVIRPQAQQTPFQTGQAAVQAPMSDAIRVTKEQVVCAAACRSRTCPRAPSTC